MDATSRRRLLAAGAWLVAILVGCSQPQGQDPANRMEKPPGQGSAQEAPAAWHPAPGPGETFPSEGAAHLPPGTPITYHTDPPTSGPHYDQWAQAGRVYDAPVNPPLLVHALEHGNVVIYFDPDRLSPAEREELAALVRRYPGQWDGVLAVPRTDPAHPVILTAWQKMLRLQTWDRQQIDAFLDAYRGRGPENPVR